MASYLATNYRIGDGVTTVWNVSFAGARPDQGDGTEAYLDSDSVKAVTVTVNADGTETTSPVSGVLVGPTQYKIEPAVAAGQTIKIYRTTERGYPLVDFTDFAAITENDLDVQARQTLYVVQELSDTVTYSDERSIAARRIAELASQAAEAATIAANEATTASGQSVTTANAARVAATNATNTANEAKQTASEAKTASGQATSTANAASTTAGEALSTANAASTKATTATNTANTASTASGQAVSTANAARTLADQASSDASAALNTANAASQVAQKASNDAQLASQVAGDVQNFRGELDDLSARVEELVGADVTSFLRSENNLSDVADAAAARSNLSIYSTTQVDGFIDTVNSRIDSVETSVEAARNTVITAGAGLSGGGKLDQNRTLSVDSTVVRTTRTVSSGDGLTGGGALDLDQSIGLGTPSTLNAGSTNSVTAESHTHKIDSTRSRTSSSDTLLLRAGAMPDHVASGDHDNRYYTKAAADQRAELVGGYVRTPTANLCYFQVPKVTAQRVNSSGNTKITFSSQDYASAYPGQDNPWYYPSTYYDRQTHEFVAPVAGVYHFFAQIVRRGGEGGGDTAVDIRFARNGIALESNGVQGFAPGKGDLGGISTYTTARIDAYLNLSAGDRIAVVLRPCDTTVHANNVGSSVPSFWGGRLL